MLNRERGSGIRGCCSRNKRAYEHINRSLFDQSPIFEPNYFDKIDDEIVWANAKKLNVHISYDREWGTSNPQAGQITPANDIRQGYEFDIEFTLDASYALSEWRAFSGTLPQNWTENLSLLDDTEVKSRELYIADNGFILASEP